MNSNKLILLLLLFILIIVLASRLMGKDSQELISAESLNSPTKPGWETYTNDTFKYTLSFPLEFEIQENGLYSNLFVRKILVPGAGPTNFVYISVIPKNDVIEEGSIYNHLPYQATILWTMQVGESKSVSVGQPELDAYFTYTRLRDEAIGNRVAKVFRNTQPWEFPVGTTERRYYVETEDYIYLIGTYFNSSGTGYGINYDLVSEIISTFRVI